MGMPKRSPGYGVWASGYAATAGGEGWAKRSPQACRGLPSRLRKRERDAPLSGDRGHRNLSPDSKRAAGFPGPETQ